MYQYAAYGLGLRSEIDLPELAASSRPGDVIVRKGKVRERPAGARTGSWFRVSPSAACLVWDHVGAFAVRNGAEIVCEPAPGASEGQIRQAIMGPVFGLLLEQRGRFPLHAAAVAIRGAAIAIAADSGGGKSSLAAALHARGHELVSDDIAAIDADAVPPVVLPGFPRFRLWPESAAVFRRDAAALPRLHEGTEKRLVAARSGFAEAPRRLSRVYLLAEESGESLTPLTRQQGLLELLRHCYNGALIRQAVGMPELTRQCARLASCIRVFRLGRRRSLAALPDLARMLEDHAVRES